MKDPMKSSKSYIINALYEWIVDHKCTPHVSVNTKHKGVIVPDGFGSDGQIVLNISMQAANKLLIEKTHISFNASFKGKRHDVIIPMGAILSIYAQENGEGMLFDTSTEVHDPIPSASPPQKTKPTLTVVK